TEVTIDLKYPEDRIADSDKLKVNITPSLLGQSMSGLEDLLGMPYGCGEQNMIFLAPDIEVLRYFKFTGQVVPAIQAKAETFITTGYQRQLTYRHTDGSFSAFGEQDESGSLWLTAFVLSTLSNARDVQTIDETVLANAANWMLGHQAADGSWEPVGTVIHQEMIGGVDGSLGISAFVTISLLDYGQADAGKVNQALDYLASHLTDERLDPYILALTTYALARAERPETATAIDLLLQAAIADSQGLHWDPHPVETTAYAAMALLLSDRMEAQQALDWLSMQRNAFGGFHSTQDTVVGLKAMTLAALSQSRNLDATLEVVVNGQTIHTFQANQANFDVLQSLEMTPADAVTLKMSGTGKLYYQVAQGYNMPLEREIPGPIPGENPLQLTVNYSAEHIAVDDIVDVRVSVLYKGEQEQTGMSIVDISIPTGFAVVADSLEKLKSDPNFKRIDQAGRKVIFYLDHFTKDKPLDFGFQVKAQYPVRADSGASTAYLYYDTNTKAEAGGLELIVE
ncbi:MAG: alpha-2-macroglobulin, partial [bacterium]|nr:alpha-2-macroglobulin [bacterium]